MVSFLTGVERTQHGPEFQSIFVYVAAFITFLILVFTYIGIHLVLRLRHSKSIKIAERTRPVLKDNMVSLKTMIILVLIISTGVAHHVYVNYEGMI